MYRLPLLMVCFRCLPEAVWSGRSEDGPGTAPLPQSSTERVPHSTQGLPGGGRQECDGEGGGKGGGLLSENLVELSQVLCVCKLVPTD